ncbi:MAG: hypothetical protein LBR84_00675 [Tannerella sp.]|jgi:hypothetical protein|nr:hypothetical protein [Tannerella sp.]
MQRKGKILSTLCCLLVLAACGKGDEAARRLEGAKALYEQKLFIAAKSEIDSINLLYPREIKVRREALTLMRLVERGESEQNIIYCDSLLPIRIGELDGLMKGFVYEKDSVYDEVGNYVWRTMTVERNVERSYIRCGVSEEGEMYMASIYFGARPIEHTGLKLSAADGSFAQTRNIPYDGGVNYRFKDNGNTTEVVNYKGDDCKSIANFVYISDPKQRIKGEYTGGKPYTVYLSDDDKRAIRATYELANVLSEITAMRKEKEMAAKRIIRLDEKLNSSN